MTRTGIPHAPSGFRKSEPTFRWRGESVSRLEALSDAVFALAMTLLVVSLKAPDTFGNLLASFKQVPVFAVGFGSLVLIWYYHYRFHRRYGLEDGVTVSLNTLLLFLVLLYVYPLRFLFTTLFDWIGGSPRSLIHSSQIPELMVLYSAGFLAIFLVLALLHVHAYRRRDDLDLDANERAHTKTSIRAHLIMVAIAALSILLASFGPAMCLWAGLVYCLIGPAQAIHGILSGKAQRAQGEKAL